MTQNISNKLKILALHGYTQNADKFKEKTYSFQRKGKKYADFMFITAPHKAPNEFEAEDKLQPDSCNINKDVGSYAWYLRQPNENSIGYVYEGLQETFVYLDKIFEEKGPFDGIFGFSQGGCLVGLLCDYQQRKLTRHVKFDFCIIASGFKYDDSELYEEKLNIPSLHIYGENDKQITSDRSEDLIECFKSPVVVKHSGGHYVPGNSTFKKEYDLFFQEQWSRKFGQCNNIKS